MEGASGYAARALRTAFVRALASIDLRARTRDALRAMTPPEGNVTVLALGKSASPMLAGAVDAWDAHIVRAISARPLRSLELTVLPSVGLEDFAAGHPLPDRRSVAAGEAICESITGRSATDTVLVLLSGGASAAVCAPREGVTLEAIRETTQRLMTEGASIEAINAERTKHDGLKGGGLRAMAQPARVLTVASLDVMGDDETALRTLGSAPTIAPTDALTDVTVIARPDDAREAMERALRGMGYRVVPAPEVRDRTLVFDLRSGEAWVLGDEATEKLPDNPGIGGRAGRVALLAAEGIAAVPGMAFLAAGTDGIDGSSDAAGAVVDSETWLRWSPEVRDAIERFEDGSFHQRAGTALVTGPTGINLLDVYAAACGGPASLRAPVEGDNEMPVAERATGMAAMGFALLLAVLTLVGVGCGHPDAPTPEATVTTFVTVMESARSDPALRQRAFELLSERARQALTERAQRASEVSGWELHPWEMLAPGRWTTRIEFDPEALTARIDGDRAVVTARGRSGGVADVPLVREGSRWRLDLALPPIEPIHPGDSIPAERDR